MIVEKVRSMFFHSKPLKSFWDEVVRIAVYLINLSPSRPLNGEIPYEVRYGKKASYSKLRVFVCMAFVHILKYKRAKLNAKTKECKYLGSPRDELGFKLRILQTRRLFKAEMWYFLNIIQSMIFNL